MADPGKPSFREDDPAAAPASSRLPRGEFRPEAVVNPPPKFQVVAYRVPPERMFDAVMAALRAAGVVIEGLDRGAGLLRGSDPMDGGAAALVTAALSPTDSGGTKVVLSYDRPPGTRMDPFRDGRRLEALFARVDEALAA
jgi:catechol 2,3-dioxygenase-like lactoylglutathione lyase family enzyme